MNKALRLVHLLSLVLLLPLLVDCAGSGRHNPRPVQESKLSPQDARDILSQSSRNIHSVVVVWPEDQDKKREPSVKVALTTTVRERDLDVRGPFTDRKGGTFEAQIPFFGPSINYYVWNAKIIFYKNQNTTIHFECDSYEQAWRFVDALAAMREYTAKGLVPRQEGSVSFVQVVERYRQANPKPTLSEETRKFKVQAEHAIQQKRYEDAISFYEEALKIAPWWAEGRFNRALLLGDSQQPAEAIDEMKKYLALEPEAKDARAAQDKIYHWESDTQQPSSGGNVRVRFIGRAKD